MIRRTHPPATRSSVLRCTRRLDQVQRGAALLKRKRQSLVQELFARVKTAVSSREALDAQSRRAYRLLWMALSSTGSHALTPLGWPTREIDIELRTSDLWGIRAVEIVHRPSLARGLAARGLAPGLDEAVSHEAAREFEVLIERVLDVAPQEQAMRSLGHALSRTTRLVNTLEQRVATRLATDLAEIRRTLSEREREEHFRIKRLIARKRSTR